MIESLFYFREANQKIIDKNIIEIANKKRSKNTDFIVLIDPEFSIQIFEICIATLKRVDIALKRNGLENDIEDLIASFASYIKSINDQIRG